MSGCCDDYNEHHQVDDDFQPADQLGVDRLPTLEYLVSELFQPFNERIDRSFELLQINSPPPANKGRFILVLAQAFLL